MSKCILEMLTVCWASFMTNWDCVILIVGTVTVWFFDGIILSRWACYTWRCYLVAWGAMRIKQRSIVWTTNRFTFRSIPSVEWRTLLNVSISIFTTCIIQIPCSTVPVNVIQFISLFTFTVWNSSNTSFWASWTIDIQTDLRKKKYFHSANDAGEMKSRPSLFFYSLNVDGRTLFQVCRHNLGKHLQ